MSISYGLGLIENAKLTREEVGRVLEATGVSCIIERVDGAFLDFMWHDGALHTCESGPGIVTLYTKLYARMGSVSSDAASAAELSALVPGNVSDKFKISRRVEGVPGLYFKSLDVALAELRGYAEENGIDMTDTLSTLDRASELKCAVVFGHRG